MLVEAVEEFNEKFGFVTRQTPLVSNLKEGMLRHSLMAEENDEYLDAVKKGDIVGIADALGDQLYVNIGTMLHHGLQNRMEAIFAEIHRSNLSKLDSNGEPIFREDGKLLKGKNYFPPNLSPIVNN